MKNLLKFRGIPWNSGLRNKYFSMSIVLMEPLEMKMVDCPEIGTRSPRLNQVTLSSQTEKIENEGIRRKLGDYIIRNLGQNDATTYD